MKSFPVDFFREAEDPGFDDAKMVGVECEIFFIIIKELNTLFIGKYIFLNKERVTYVS